MSGRIVALLLVLLMVLSASMTPVAVAQSTEETPTQEDGSETTDETTTTTTEEDQENTQEEQDTSQEENQEEQDTSQDDQEATQDEEQQASGEEPAVKETETRVVDVSNILTVTELNWREDNSVEVSVQADQRHTVTYVVQKGGDRFILKSVTVPEGQSTIVIEEVTTKFALVSQSQGYEFTSPAASLVDLPPSEWNITYVTFFGAILGAIAGVAYKYKKTVYEAEDKIQSIYDIKWW